MKAVVLVAGDRHELLEVPTPVPGRGEIRIRVEASGICGTDLSIMHGDFPSGRGRPLVMGHEFAGVVDEVGPDCGDFAPGQRVAADPNEYCRRCEWCERGAYNLCTNWAALGITQDGALAEYVCVDSSFAVHLPDSVSFTAGALIEPLSCTMHAFEIADVARGESMLVIGGGMLGLSSVILAREMGHEVTVVETHPVRRELALSLGASRVAAPGESLDDAQFHYVVEATGVPAAIGTAMGYLRPRGTLLQLGAAPPDYMLPVNAHDVFQRELRIIGSFSVADRYEAAARMITSVGDSLERLVTHEFGLEDFADALEAMASPSALKIHINPTKTKGATET